LNHQSIRKRKPPRTSDEDSDYDEEERETKKKRDQINKKIINRNDITNKNKPKTITKDCTHNNKINEKLDLIFIDSYHEPNHIKKIFYNYYKYLKTDGICIIDDISWLPYSKFNISDNDFIERINRLTFEKILNIYNSNTENFILDFHFVGAGLAIIKKIKDELYPEKKLKNRLYTIKNILKTIYSPKPIK
jgi:predicted O-methyltransferase YrrM